ncbi:MAG: glycoside hydrolase family 99-like domain-containing protein [Pseudomonadota bacterium]
MSSSPAPLVPAKETLLLAFFLPQFHPIPENDRWWGKGFTEWSNVNRGRPLFRGHYQPHVPADLGFYDLRVPEVREQQADLARAAGLNGFVYYHYWFNGRRLLERPVNDLLRSRRPDFPFCLCWANEPWSRNWDGNSRQVLMPQSYSAVDDLNHIHWLLEAFADDRYLKIDGRPLFLVYRPSQLPDIRETAAVWRREAVKKGFPDLFLCAVRAFPEEFCDPAIFGLDASVEFKPNGTDRPGNLDSADPLDIGYRLHRVWEYDIVPSHALAQPVPDYPFFTGVCPSWDNSVRRKEGGLILRDSTPEKYGAWLRAVLDREQLRAQKESLVFVNAWNEWAEGNHLEPCQRWGHGYLDATRAAVQAARAHRDAVSRFMRGQTVRPDSRYQVTFHRDSVEYLPGLLLSSGWCVEADTLTPPDVLAYGIHQADDSFLLLSLVEKQRIARSDVSQALSAPQGLLSGWTGRLQLNEATPHPGRIHILALRGRDGAAAIVTGLG